MSSGAPLAHPDRWQAVFEMGVRLLSPGLRASPEQAHGKPAFQTDQEIHLQEQPAYPASETLNAQKELILETAGRLLSAQACLWLAAELAPLAEASPASAVCGPGLLDEPLSELMSAACQARRLKCRSGAAGSPASDVEAYLQAAQQIQDHRPAAVAAPLLAEDSETGGRIVLGVLQAERLEGPQFDSQDLSLLLGLAAQAAIALQAARQAAIERWRVQQLALVRKVSSQIANVRHLDELSRRVTGLILDTFSYYYVAIFTLEPGEDVLHFRASAGPRPKEPQAEKKKHSPDFAVHLGQGLIGCTAETGEEILAQDVSQEPRYRYTDALPETRSEVTLPLKIEQRVLGVLDVQSDQVDDFHATDMLVLRALAGNIANAVEGARLYSALRTRAEQLSTIYEVSNAITSVLDLDELLNEVVRLIGSRFGFPYVHLFSVHPGRRKIFYQAGSGLRSQALLEQGLVYDLDDERGIIPWVARHGETLVANDVESEPRYRPSELPPEDTRSELAVPLIFGGQVLGVLDVQSDRVNAFDDEARFLLEALADNVAIALRNASLYRSERWRRQVADSLREVAGLLSAEADLDQVLGAILTELDRTLPCEAAAIWLMDEEYGEGDGNGVPPLRLAAVSGSQASQLNLETGLSLGDIMSAYTDVIAATGEQDGLTPQAPTWLVQGIEAEQPVVRGEGSPYEPLGAALHFPADYSAIAAPLRVGAQELGLLVMAHSTPGRYGSEARAMTAAFASYASVAIENTRLYEAAHEQAWVSTVLLQVAEATQSITNLNELLATVVRITPMLVGVKACALYMLDEAQTFVPAAAYGLKHEQQIEFERWRFAAGEVPAFDRLVEEKHPLILFGEESDPLLSSILFPQPLEAGDLDEELLILVPLLAHGEVLGAFLIDYAGDGLHNSSLESLEEMFDERLAIIQGIAHQTAIAIENSRLIKAQKEEAYVSVALLQVAQAVVSSYDLEDVLGSIVRITPILVGVKRAVIYLWEAAAGKYRLAQGYGIPRQSGERAYAPIEFPLLEAVRHWDSMIACPLNGEGENGEEPPDSWSHLIPPDLDQVDELLQQPGSLLMAFPLSVKGSVLGVLLVEEPEPVIGDSFASSWRRLREKRLEITTGISQQAALAIQNDLLQKEMVERERLEREFQLAREIQQAFLPRFLPDLPGWDLNVRWRTAHEVGGDFYDYFELPGQRFGLVIADVTDKGMPAALFMTLIRTLVRATVHEFDSPAKVLERVNDVLVPDAQQGMFVTIFYAVLDLESGRLDYANAGHPPPFVLRKDGGMEPLYRSGMALGVLEGSLEEERTVWIEPGDFLICYTDGVTEAFSEAGEMYGDERLRGTILAAHQPGKNQDDLQADHPQRAQAMLDAVESSLSQFVGSAPRSDDLTMMVLYRLDS